jgi:lantibiotic modifying enzyme
LNAIAPLANASRRRVRAAIAASPVTPGRFDIRDALVQDLERMLFYRLFLAASPTLVVELAVASEHGPLAGDSPEDRFGFFCDCLCDKVFVARLLAQYPTLARRSSASRQSRKRRRSKPWRGRPRPSAPAHLLSVMIRVCGQMPNRLATTLAVVALCNASPLLRAHGLSTSRGPSPWRAACLHTTWLNEAGLAPALRAAAVLDRGACGWAKWLAASPCAGEEGVRRYFRRQGANRARAYRLGAVDLHFENVVAAGEHPIIVDLETMFEASAPTAALGPASAAAFEALSDSVIRTPLIPIRIDGDADGGRRSADVSALGDAGGEQSIYFAQGWDQTGSDATRMAEIGASMPSATCLPLLDSRRVPAGHVEDIVTGLTATYGLLMTRRSALGAMATSPLGRFRGAPARRFVRPTSSVARLLNESWHPALAEDAEQL